MKDEPLPCPWCGEVPKVESCGKDYWTIKCSAFMSGIRCFVMPDTLSRRTEAEAIAAWNKRYES